MCLCIYIYIYICMYMWLYYSITSVCSATRRFNVCLSGEPGF